MQDQQSPSDFSIIFEKMNELKRQNDNYLILDYDFESDNSIRMFAEICNEISSEKLEVSYQTFS